MRLNRRKPYEIRPLNIDIGVMKYAEGSSLIEMGDTKVLCSATVEEKIPPFLKDTGTGWVTTEYSMLPRATITRTRRDSVRGKIGGRSHEIQRIIGRSLRSITNLQKLGERTILIDCDVVQADGGTRTASITGAFVALSEAVNFLNREGILTENPINDYIAAISVGIVDGELLLDLDYEEDTRAEVDMNIAMTRSGNLVEVQGTAEGKPFSKNKMNGLIKLAEKGIMELISKQREILT
ncbi:MAG: ribonuclease PH [Thermodesulfobacteriota bacterium]